MLKWCFDWSEPLLWICKTAYKPTGQPASAIRPAGFKCGSIHSKPPHPQHILVLFPFQVILFCPYNMQLNLVLWLHRTLCRPCLIWTLSLQVMQDAGSNEGSLRVDFFLALPSSVGSFVTCWELPVTLLSITLILKACSSQLRAM